MVPEMMDAGAKGYVVKDELTDQLVAAIYAVYAGQVYLSPIAQDYMDRCSIQSVQHHLTPREQNVLKLLAQGVSTQGIADALSIDPRTVHNYIYTLRRKTGCEERTEMSNWYRRMYGTP
jgi:DNA-binding NarL/FixJ family response regulator